MGDMKQKQSSRRPAKKSKKKTYKIRNWKEYNESLVQRGNIFLWISQDAREHWYNKNTTGKRGRPELFSDTAISSALTIGQVFRLPLRQTQGCLNSFLRLMNIHLVSPDYSTLSIRGENLNTIIRPHNVSNEQLHIVVDSTGAKVFGEGEWKVRQHGWSKHRTWIKLHLAIDEKTRTINAGEVTGNNTADCEVLPNLLNKIVNPLRQVSADGAYDKRICYNALAKRNIKAAIPPQKNAKIWQHGNSHNERLARDENLRRIREVGKKQWKEEIGYHRRSIAETTIFRIKTIFGDKISARTFQGQVSQLLLRCNILNQMTLLGMPESIVVA